MENIENKEVIRFITKERFLKAKNSGNYGDVSEQAEEIIGTAEGLDVLELRLQEGSAYNVVSAIKVDEQRFLKLLRNIN